jgi:hypothetical protein
MKNLVAKAQPRRLDQNDVDYGEFGFDVTQYSVKYTGCSAIETYSDDAAEESDTVLRTKRFVVFRLCLTDSCNKYEASGCSSDYGEYVLEMGDYLETMNQYNEEKLENYCQYCEECAGAQDAAAEEEAADDQVDEEGDAAAEEDDAGRKRRLEEGGQDEEQAAEGDAQEEEAAAEDEDAYATCNSVCQDSANVCNVEQEGQEGEEGEEQQEEIDAADYFECVKIDAGGDDGSSYYLGPHCSDDGFSIVIGLYSDEWCSTYVGNETSVYDATGIDLSGADMSVYYPQDCLSCLENVRHTQTLIFELFCFSFHSNSRFCLFFSNTNMKTMQTTMQTRIRLRSFAKTCTWLVPSVTRTLLLSTRKPIMYVTLSTLKVISCHILKRVLTLSFAIIKMLPPQSAQQLANEEQVCNFIDNIVSGTYDESGDIIIDSSKYNISDWRNKDQYINVLHAAQKEVTGGQVAGLVLSILGCSFLCMYACVLHSSLTKKGLQWKPRRGKYTDPTAISRQNSGIVLGRSRSGPNGPLV